MILHCGHEPSEHGEHTTGTAHMNDGHVICWDCAGMRDLGRMLLDGNSRSLPLYLHNGKVSNWPGTLTFPIMGQRKGSHNIGGTRTDVWFVGPDAHVWHGVSIGEYTEIVHCKRTREVWKQATKAA